MHLRFFSFSYVSFLFASLFHSLPSASSSSSSSSFRRSKPRAFPLIYSHYASKVTKGRERIARPGSFDCSDGTWIHDPTVQMRYDHPFKESYKGWNCISNNKANDRDLIMWRRMPKGSDLPPLDPLWFLQRF